MRGVARAVAVNVIALAWLASAASAQEETQPARPAASPSASPPTSTSPSASTSASTPPSTPPATPSTPPSISTSTATTSTPETAPTATSPAGASSSTTAEGAWHLDGDLGTDFPIDFAARVQAEAPFRLRLSTSLGLLPSFYVGAINGILVGLNAYEQSTADLIEVALESSLVWRTHVGFRPFPRAGFYGDLGYGLVTLGGDASAAEIIAGVTGRSLPQQDQGARRTFDVASTLHMLDVELGWDFLFGERFHLRTALGGAFTLASSTKIEPQYRPLAPNLTKGFTDYGERYLDEVYTSYVFTPVISVSAGYRFF